MHMLIHPWTSGPVWPLCQGTRTASYLAPDCWIRCRTILHWFGRHGACSLEQQRPFDKAVDCDSDDYDCSL